MQRRTSSVLIALALALTAGCRMAPVRYEPLVIAELEEKLGGCAVGDLVPGGGKEVAVVSVSGALRVIEREADGSRWTVLDAGRASGEMIQVAVGDVWPDRGGDELVAVGMLAGDEDSGGEGAVFVSGLDGGAGGFDAQPVFTDTALVHAVAVCDLDPTVPGDEALVGGFSNALTLLRFHADGRVEAETIGTSPDAAKGMVPYRDGVAVACRDGSLQIVSRTATGFELDVPFRAPAGLARLATDGSALLAASDDGALWLVEGREGRRLHRESKKLRGAVLAELDGGSPGLEAATVGYTGRVSLLRRDGEGWTVGTPYVGDSALHHLASGELNGLPGPELVAVGFAGQVVLLQRDR